MKKVLVMYVPAIHASYINFWEQFREEADTLLILGDEILERFPVLKREIRAITPQQAARAVQGLGHFPYVEVATPPTLQMLRGLHVVMSDEHISDEVRARYLVGSVVEQHPFFLRFDEKYVRAAYGEVKDSHRITWKTFHRQMMKIAEAEAVFSADWFRRVGCVLVLGDQLALKAHNKRMPTAQDTWMVGDPRLYIPYLTATELRTVLHGEQVIIARAAREGIATAGASLYVSVFPCPDCLNVIAEAGISRIYYRTGYAQLPTVNDVLAAYDIEVVRVS